MVPNRPPEILQLKDTDRKDLSDLLRCPDELSAQGEILVHPPTGHERESFAMRLMRARPVARIYEKHWRPLLLSVVSSLNDDEEDAVVDRYLQAESPAKILDLCCGTARASRRWIGTGARALAIDRSSAMLREARRQCPSEALVLVCGDVLAPLAAAEAFDAVFCFAALHLFETPSSVIHAAAFATRPGGLLFVWALTAQGVLSSRLTRTLAVAAGLHAMAPRELRHTITRCGFDAVDERAYGAVELLVGRRRT